LTNANGSRTTLGDVFVADAGELRGPVDPSIGDLSRWAHC
jgi:hypothetical protein